MVVEIESKIAINGKEFAQPKYECPWCNIKFKYLTAYNSHVRDCKPYPRPEKY